jgi:hypothetical protein
MCVRVLAILWGRPVVVVGLGALAGCAVRSAGAYPWCMRAAAMSMQGTASCATGGALSSFCSVHPQGGPGRVH